MLGIVAVLLIAGGVFLLWPKGTQAPVGDTATSTATTTEQEKTVLYASPENIEDYIKAMDKYSSEGGTNPALTWKFGLKQTIVPEGSSSEAYAAEVAANQVGTGGGPGRIMVTHFTVVGNTAYILTNIDENGWAGVSFAQNKVRPMIEKTLLLNQSITKVVFGLPPKLNASTSLQ